MLDLTARISETLGFLGHQFQRKPIENQFDSYCRLYGLAIVSRYLATFEETTCGLTNQHLAAFWQAGASEMMLDMESPCIDNSGFECSFSGLKILSRFKRRQNVPQTLGLFPRNIIQEGSIREPKWPKWVFPKTIGYQSSLFVINIGSWAMINPQQPWRKSTLKLLRIISSTSGMGSSHRWRVHSGCAGWPTATMRLSHNAVPTGGSIYPFHSGRAAQLLQKSFLFWVSS